MGIHKLRITRRTILKRFSAFFGPLGKFHRLFLHLFKHRVSCLLDFSGRVGQTLIFEIDLLEQLFAVLLFDLLRGLFLRGFALDRASLSHTILLTVFTCYPLLSPRFLGVGLAERPAQ